MNESSVDVEVRALRDGGILVLVNGSSHVVFLENEVRVWCRHTSSVYSFSAGAWNPRHHRRALVSVQPRSRSVGAVGADALQAGT